MYVLSSIEKMVIYEDLPLFFMEPKKNQIRQKFIGMTMMKHIILKILCFINSDTFLKPIPINATHRILIHVYGLQHNQPIIEIIAMQAYRDYLMSSEWTQGHVEFLLIKQLGLLLCSLKLQVLQVAISQASQKKFMSFE